MPKGNIKFDLSNTESFWRWVLLVFVSALLLVFVGQTILMFWANEVGQQQVSSSPAGGQNVEEAKARNVLRVLESRPERLLGIFATTSSIVDPSL